MTDASRLGRARRAGAVAAALGCAALLATAPEDLGARRLRAMRAEAEGVTVQMARAGSAERLPIGAEPIYRFDDPARGFVDGTLWALGKGGRPSVLLCVSAEKVAGADCRWLFELTALTDARLTGRGPGWSLTWTTPGLRLAFQPFPAAQTPAPADDEPARLRQLKALARRFHAYELRSVPGRSDPSRDDLRILPRPVARYADPAAGIVDGAIFLIAYGQNPELALLIEARRQAGQAPAWAFALGRITAAEAHLELDGREVLAQPGIGTTAPDEPYWIHLVPMDDPQRLFNDRTDSGDEAK